MLIQAIELASALVSLINAGSTADEAIYLRDSLACERAHVIELQRRNHELQAALDELRSECAEMAAALSSRRRK